MRATGLPLNRHANREIVALMAWSSPQENKQFTVSDIKIGGLYKDIAVYDMPSAKTGTKLTKNPYDGTRIWLDLANIKEIRVPAPDTIWEYKDPKKSKPCEYIEVMIISIDNTQNRYLIETKHKLTFKDVNGSTKMEVPFSDLKSLVVGGNQRCTPAPKKSASAPKNEIIIEDTNVENIEE